MRPPGRAFLFLGLVFLHRLYTFVNYFTLINFNCHKYSAFNAKSKLYVLFLHTFMI